MKYYYSFMGLLMMLVISCNKLVENHYHDGIYMGQMWDVGGEWVIQGNKIIISNPLSGVTKVECVQFKDRIEYKMPDGAVKILTVLENGDLEYSNLLILKKIKSEEESLSDEKEEKREINQVKKSKNQTQNFVLSKDSFDNEPAYIKDILIVENKIYIVLDIAQIKYLDEDIEIINENTKLRTYKISSDVLVREYDCKEQKTSKYFIDNKTKILSEKENFRMVSTNTKGELTYINFGCWS